MSNPPVGSAITIADYARPFGQPTATIEARCQTRAKAWHVRRTSGEEGERDGDDDSRRRGVAGLAATSRTADHPRDRGSARARDRPADGPRHATARARRVDVRPRVHQRRKTATARRRPVPRSATRRPDPGRPRRDAIAASKGRDAPTNTSFLDELRNLLPVVGHLSTSHRSTMHTG